MNREDFALAYSVMQVGRTIFLGSTPPGRTMARLNAVPILIWLVVSAIFWVAGGFPGGQSRLVLWAMALGIEYLSPAERFWVPKYGASCSDPRISLCTQPLALPAGTILFKHTFRGFLQLSHGVGIVALGVLYWFAGHLSPLLLSILVSAIMVMVGVWESISLSSKAQSEATSA